MFAAGVGHVEIVRLLLNHDQDINAHSTFGWGALSLAASNGHLPVCQLLLQHGARLDFYAYNMPLHCAAGKGHIEICKLFIEKGADINCVNKSYETPIYCAAHFGHLHICKLLLSSGATIPEFDVHGKSILTHALESENLELVEYLLVRGVAIEGKPRTMTPLMAAAQRNYFAILKTLLSKGVSVDQTDRLGRTALLYA